MKHCVTIRSVFGVFCVVLVCVQMGWTRPASSRATYSPPLNCSNPAVWTPEQHPREPSEDLAVDPASDIEDLIPKRSYPASSPRTPRYRHSTPHSLPDFYYSQNEAEYFDYYYEEHGEINSDLEDTPDARLSVQYQQPPPGLNRVAKLKLIKMPRRQPPEYMLELYNRFSRAKPPVTTHNPNEPADQSDLVADIVRSFPNINKEDSVKASPERSEVNNTEENQLAGGDTRHHTLVFNITSLLTGEEVSRAELRLFTLMEQDRNTYIGEDRMVRVYEGLNTNQLPPVASRHVYGHLGGWEAFDVTSVVQAWVTKGSRTGDGVQVLEVKIDTLFRSGDKGSGTTMDIDVDPEHNEGPLLVVFSKDTSWHLQQELRDLISHETASDEDTDDNDDLSDSSDDFRSTEESKSVSYEPVSSSRTPRSTDRGRELFLSMSAVPVTPEKPLKRVRREKQRKRNSCRRKTMYVDFQDINWDQWIIAPPGYMAFECVGKCYFPIGAHLSPTKHAIVQTMVHETHPKRAARACCVPTKLEPISILYLDENNVITYKYHYDGMVVARCGCR